MTFVYNDELFNDSFKNSDLRAIGNWNIKNFKQFIFENLLLKKQFNSSSYKTIKVLDDLFNYIKYGDNGNTNLSYEFLNLTTNGTNLKNIIKNNKWDEKSSYSFDYCLVIKNNTEKYKKLNSNSIQVFFELTISQTLTEPLIQLKRIEFNEIDYFLNNNISSNETINFFAKSMLSSPLDMQDFMEKTYKNQIWKAQKIFDYFDKYKNVQGIVKKNTWDILINLVLNKLDKNKNKNNFLQIKKDKYVFLFNKNYYLATKNKIGTIIDKSLCIFDAKDTNQNIIFSDFLRFNVSKNNTKENFINKELNSVLENKKRELEELKTNTSNLKINIEENTKEQEEKEKECTILNSEIKSLNDQNNDYHDLKKEIDELNKEFKKLKKIKDENIDYDDQVDHLESTIKQKTQIISQINVNQIISDLRSKNLTLRNLESKLDELAKENNKFRDIINDNLLKQDQYKNDIKKYHEWIEELNNNDNINFIYLCEKQEYKDNESKIDSENNLTLEDVINDQTEEFTRNYFDNEIAYADIKDQGTLSKYIRYKAAFTDIDRGSYKNPYLIASIFTPTNIPLNVYQAIKNEIINNKYLANLEGKLNEEQKEAVYKAVASRDSFYLQGPPGTGKTQTICAIAQVLLKQNKNVLMTSSTHEAIENFFDRLNDLNYNNPNFVLYKEDKNNKNKRNHIYKKENLYDNFLNKIENNFQVYCSNNNFEIDDDIRSINKYINDHYLQYYENKNLNFNFYIGKLNENMSINEIDSYFDFSNNSNYKASKSVVDAKHLILFIKQSFLEDYLNIENEKSGDFSELRRKIDDLLTKLDKLNLLNSKLLTFKQIKNAFSDTKQDYFLQKINTYNEQHKNQSNNADNELIHTFFNYVYNNELINVIGLTTTAKATINGFKDSKDLYTQYPIDTVIIDEISKSCTPEILSRITLTSKVVFSGDYRQLPPKSDLSEEFLKEIECSNKEDVDKFIKTTEPYFNNIKLHDDKKFYELVELLFNASFFDGQVKTIKQTNTNSYIGSTKTYQALKEQHRFNAQIMSIVNLSYDTDEKLRMPLNSTKDLNSDLKFEYQGISYNQNSGVIFIDTTHITNDEFLNKIINKDVQDYNYNQNSLDDLVILNKKDLNIKSTGYFSEYDAYTIIQILKSIQEKNPIEQIKKQIGIICLTRNQVNIIKAFIKKDNALKELEAKVDTIDNFQGREKKYIIVDFIRTKYKLEKSHFTNREKIATTDFIREDRRINVAISRAQKTLILVGSFQVYQELLIEEPQLLIKKLADKAI